MGAVVFNLTTAGLLVLMFKAGVALVGEDTIRRRALPWAAIGLTAVAVAGVAAQLCWSGAFGTFDNDPAKSGWWRIVTSVFVQNGGVGGAVWNLATIAAIAALAQWFWGGPLMIALFAAGILLPQHIDALFGMGDRTSTNPRDFAGSSGATYFLAATLSAALLMRVATRAGDRRAAAGAGDRKADRNNGLLALAAPAAGLAMWFAQSNGHGLVAAYGFGLGAVIWIAAGPRRRAGTPVTNSSPRRAGAAGDSELSQTPDKAQPATNPAPTR